MDLVGTFNAHILNDMERKLTEEAISIDKKNKFITIEGIVIPVDWDEKGNAVSVAISTHDEDEYLVSNDSKGKELLNLVREEVKVTGHIKEAAGKKIITVRDSSKWKLNDAYGSSNLARKK